MTQGEESKLDRALEMLVRLDEKLTLYALQLADHESRLRTLEKMPSIKWRDIGAIIAAAAASSMLVSSLIGIAR